MIGKIRMVLALLVVAVATIVLMPVQYLAVKKGFPRPGLAPRLFHRIALKALGFRVHMRGAIAKDRPLLVVANHVSWSDICVLGSLAELSFVAKSEMAGWPVLGTFAYLQRTVFVERERKRKAGEQASELGTRLAAHDVMVLFAEGTTGDGNFLQPFKSTLFGAAQIALNGGGAGRVLVQPVAIVYTRLHGMAMGRQHRVLASWIGDMDLGPHLAALLREGAIDVVVEFGEPIEFTAESDRKRVTRQVEDAVRGMTIEALRNP